MYELVKVAPSFKQHMLCGLCSDSYRVLSRHPCFAIGTVGAQQARTSCNDLTPCSFSHYASPGQTSVSVPTCLLVALHVGSHLSADGPNQRPHSANQLIIHIKRLVSLLLFTVHC